jgi:Glycosyl transferase family 2/Methyltransferase domain
MMGGAPKVSVLVPFLDEAEFISEAVESVLAQSFENWELLLVDDGSSDGSSDIARDYAAGEPGRIHYFQHDDGLNRGMSASRNLGLRNARSEYVAFLDADDVWVAQKLEEQLELLEDDAEAAMVFGPAERWYSWTGRADDAGRDIAWSPFRSEGRVEGTSILTSLIRAPAPTTTTSMVRRDSALHVGGFEEGFRGMHEDQAFFVKVCLTAPVLSSGECWYRWRQHPDSCCEVSLRDGAWPWQRRRFYAWVAYMLRETGVNDEELWRVLQGEMSRVESEVGLAGDTRHVSRWRRLLGRGRIASYLPRRKDPLPDSAPPVGGVDLGDLKRTEPVSRQWGFDRGLPIDRYYIEGFLARHADDVRGRVLEVGDDSYTRRFGGNRVALTDVLTVGESPQATIVGDLATADQVQSDAFDCIVLTQTLQLIFDVSAAVRTLHRILKPGGVVLATAPGITHRGDSTWGQRWQWSFTTNSASALFGGEFGPENVEVEAHGNVLAAVAFLEGLAAEEFNSQNLDARDPAYEVLIAIRATKAIS